jgi:hypothetical protein
MSLKHVKKFVQGKQGITGLVEVDGQLYVYKTSQYMNHLCEHEYRIMKSLENVNKYCPHFCRAVEIIHVPINPSLDDPFSENTGLPIPVLLMEYIPESISLFDLIRDLKVGMDVIVSLIKRIMISVLIAQDKCGFVHYDLHTQNILIRKVTCDVCLYILPDGTSFVIPSYGYDPIIIDFGFGRCSDMEGNQLTIALAYTDSGYMSPYYDPISDIKILLVSLADDLKSYRPGEANALRTITKVFFRDLRIDWESGWDNDKEEPVIEEIVAYIQDDVPSRMFNEYSHLAIDILHGLITLPIESRVERNIRSLRTAYNAIIEEFLPIEKVLNNIAYSLYIFRHLIDMVRDLRPSIQSAIRDGRSDDVSNIIAELSTTLNEKIDGIVKYAYFENNLERLVYALYAFQDQLETQLHYRTIMIQNDKMSEYRKCKIHTPQEMYLILDINFPLKVLYDTNTVFNVYDAQDEVRAKFSLHNDECAYINRQHSFRHARLLHGCWADVKG